MNLVSPQVIHEHVQVIHIDARADEDQGPEPVQELNRIEIIEDAAPDKWRNDD